MVSNSSSGAKKRETAEGVLEYPAQSEGFGRRLGDVFAVRWVVPEAPDPETAEVRTRLAPLGSWAFPAGVYECWIQGREGPPVERRFLLGDRRQRRREVDAGSLAYDERRGSGDRRKQPDEPGWH